MPLVTAPVGVAREEAFTLLKRNKVEKLPLVDEQGRLRGLITVKDFTKSEQFPQRHQGPRQAVWSSALRLASAKTPNTAPRRSPTRAPTSSSWIPRTAITRQSSRWSAR